MLYLIPSPDSLELPEGTQYRILSSRKDLFKDSFGNGCHVLQSDALLSFEPVRSEDFDKLGDLSGCIEPFIKHSTKHLDDEIQAAVDKITELSYKYPAKVADKLKGKVDKDTTEGLLSANGKPVKIDAPQGWK